MLTIRPALLPDQDAVCRFLHDRMNSSVPVETWRRLTDRRWAADVPEFGVVAEDAGRLVGFLGVVYANREIAGERRRTGNLTAWFVERDYRGRGLGLDMLRAALARDDVTYTTFSSNPRALRLMQKAGLRLLDDRRLMWNPGVRADTRVEISADIRRHADRLPVAARQALADHVGLGLDAVIIREPGGAACLVIFYVKTKRQEVAFHEVLHVGDPPLFARHVRAFAAHVLPPDGRAVVSVDSRFLAGDASPDAVEEIPVPRYFRPAGLAPAETDFLYSEIVLLNLGLY